MDRIATLRRLVAAYEAELPMGETSWDINGSVCREPEDGSAWYCERQGKKFWLVRLPARYNTPALRAVLRARRSASAAVWAAADRALRAEA